MLLASVLQRTGSVSGLPGFICEHCKGHTQLQVPHIHNQLNSNSWKAIGGVTGAINAYSNTPPLPQQPVTKEMHLNAMCDNRNKGVLSWGGLAKWHQRVTTAEPLRMTWRRELDKKEGKQTQYSFFCTLTGARGVRSVRLCTQVSGTTHTHRCSPGGGVAESWTSGALSLCAPLELAHRTGWGGQEKTTKKTN